MKSPTGRIGAVLALVLLSAWLGSRLPLTDFGYQDLAYGRHVARAGELTLPPVRLSEPVDEEGVRGWLGSWLLFHAYDGGDERSLRAVAAVSLALGSVLLFTVAARWVAGFVAVAVGLLVVATRLEIATTLFSWLLAAGLVFLFERARRSSWLMGAIPALLVLWACLNRDAAAGLALVVLFAAGELVRLESTLRSEPSAERAAAWKHLGLLSGALAAGLVALALLPGGLANAPNPFAETSFYSQVGFDRWEPLTLAEDFLLLALATLGGFLAGRVSLREASTPVVALAIATAALFFSGHAVVFWAPLLAWTSSQGLVSLEHAPFPPKRGLVPILATTLVALALAAWVSRVVASHHELDAHPFARVARFLVEEDLPGPSVHPPQTGGLLDWSLDADYRPFADLRPGSVRAYRQLQDEGGLEARMVAPETRSVLLTHDLAGEPSRAKLGEAGFAVLYFDDHVVLYARRESLPGAITTLEVFDPFAPPGVYAEEALPGVISELHRYLSRRPASTLAWQRLGGLLLRRRQPEQALLAFESARASSPGNVDILLELSRLYLQKEMYRLAEDATRQGLRRLEEHDDPRWEELAFGRALSLYGQARFNEAADHFEAVMASSEQSERGLAARRYLVDIYRRLEEPDKAMALIETLDALENDRVSEHLAAAERSKAGHDFVGAAAELQKAHEIRPHDADILWELALTLLGARNETLAADVLRELVEVAPSAPDAHLTLGALCARRVSCAAGEAREHLETFLRLAPEGPNAQLASDLLDGLSQSGRAQP